MCLAIHEPERLLLCVMKSALPETLQMRGMNQPESNPAAEQRTKRGMCTVERSSECPAQTNTLLHSLTHSLTHTHTHTHTPSLTHSLPFTV